jgi:mannose-6-phosphate isomerase-like protein (cupin superfamily)
MAKSTIDTQALESAEVLSGPHTLFHASFTVAFLVPPPELSATVLLRATYVGEKQALGKKHPQSPPLHLHFDQSESFLVVQGAVGLSIGWNGEYREEVVRASEGGVREVGIGVPHT